MTPNLQFLTDRATLLRELRTYFDERGFLEVQPPCLSRDCVVDAYIDPITVSANRLGCPDAELPNEMYLQTSPELAMKRFLVAGAPSIYSIGPAFRAGEQGRVHNPEFTLLEWYQVGAAMTDGIGLLGSLVADILDRPGYDVCTYRELFRNTIGVDPVTGAISKLRDVAQQVDPNLSESVADDRDMLLDVILSHQIQPRLGHARPQIVTDYPLSQAALAKPSTEDSKCAARFELFAGGIEIANGYDELLDADVLVQRAIACNEKRATNRRIKLEVETSLVRAMRHGMPPCTGVALGVDRLLMVRVGADSIHQVIPLTIEIA